jgi:hypothetical protein
MNWKTPKISFINPARAGGVRNFRWQAGGEQIDCLEKPFTTDQLAQAVRMVLDRADSAKAGD